MKDKHTAASVEDLDELNSPELDILEGETEQDTAFIDSANRTWAGKPIKPYAAMRRATAQRMGLRYGKLTEEDIAEFKETGQYPGLPADVYIVLWECVKASNSDVLKAQRLPDWGLEQAYAWADEQKIEYPSERFVEAAILFSNLVADTHHSTGIPVEPEADPKAKKRPALKNH